MNIKFVLSCFFCLIGVQAFAQFQGDVYFEDASVIAVPNGNVSLDLQAFTGTSVLGAGHFQVTYDVNVLEFESFELSSGSVLSSHVDSTSGIINFLLVNDESNIEPIGTVSLGDLNFRTLSQETVTLVRLEVLDLLEHETSRFREFNGFSAEVIVSSSNLSRAVVSSDPPIQLLQGAAQAERVLKLRRAGSLVWLFDQEGGDRLIRRSYFVTDGKAPSGE